ncbi:2,3-bisphosphoglycerate-independent phosphoglycerate mutase [Methanobrevibacter boviskoreani]|uniref:2,3-bisphosphoglycerate-independent phosphoglycerate mutase n=1 Tax=Methanobrevibacter boviskoreani TaxID=1348249 RepID=UPI0023A851E2|nr:2,3-bisphosphoglycerate-independent phosphoglycerate mutase [Methanobrevibacter boviskoreani]MCI6775709.1 2,3-bisphosphoglycerate-independent phosphoglycerate mutase [Methanobrevibacter boviskoreani]MCI6931171.1 2,3-bisphosphoglycerate-independent phosphoglycerate mutase [Methanobrevibacter boviskoreani]
MKGMILVMDGMGDRPIKELNNQTPLQAANTPNMDQMAKEGITGIMDSIAPGIRPGSDTAHLSILGYNPYEVYTGRGPFEASGVALDVIPGDIAFRCNFSTMDENGIVTDRRAGRIREGTKDLVEKLNTMVLDDYKDIKIIFKESTGHRAVLVLRGEGLSDKVSDADPKVEGKAPAEVLALDGSAEAEKTADILNKVVAKTYEMLKDHPVNLERIKNDLPPANVVIPRGAGAVPEVEPINDKYEINSACIAETGLIMGIARFAGMDVIEMEDVTGGVDTNLDNIRDTIIDQVKNSDHDFFLINIDGADEAGHDGNVKQKVEFIEKVDKVVMSELLKLEDVYIFLTADHSTPISVKNHTGDPVPILIRGPEVRTDDVEEYNEFATYKGGLCRIRGSDVMNIMMDYMNYSHKFGA